MIVVLLLYVLATTDAACSSHRTASGRNALIHKEAYYRRAVLRGALAGQATVAITGLCAVIMIITASDPLWGGLVQAGEVMLLLYVPYAGVVLAAFAIRTIPSVNLRSLLSVLIFGPFTLIRPLVVVSGVIFAIISVRRFEVVALGLLILILRFSIERRLEWRAGQGDQAKRLAGPLDRTADL